METAQQNPPLYIPHPDKVDCEGCIVIVGMAAAGKTTIGRELAALLDWPQLDTDHLIESTYGASLNSISLAMDKEKFLDIEAEVICSLRVRRTIVSTGGSAVYRPEAMEYLKTIGPIIYIDVPLPIILERINRKPDRGLAIAPGQTVEDLYLERKRLYESYATYTLTGGEEQAATYASRIAAWLERPWEPGD